jgi:hypothetical protein
VQQLCTAQRCRLRGTAASLVQGNSPVCTQLMVAATVLLLLLLLHLGQPSAAPPVLLLQGLLQKLQKHLLLLHPGQPSCVASLIGKHRQLWQLLHKLQAQL